MKHFLKLFMVFLFTIPLTAQTQDLNQYSYVVVPDKFEFQNSPNQYQLNSMMVFYLEKYGFNASVPNKASYTDRCDGLFADVEELNTFFGTKLQIVLRDCDSEEVYRSDEGKSKYKEFEKSYQDALRKAFKSMEMLGVHQKRLKLLDDSNSGNNKNKPAATDKPDLGMVPTNLPGSLATITTTANYLRDGISYLLRKTSEGFSFYKSNGGEDAGQLLGKIIVMGQIVKFIDVSGNVFDVNFDASGNFSIIGSTSSSSRFYHRVD